MKSILFLTAFLISASAFAGKLVNSPCEIAANDRAHGFLDQEWNMHGPTTGLKVVSLDEKYDVTISSPEQDSTIRITVKKAATGSCRATGAKMLDL